MLREAAVILIVLVGCVLGGLLSAPRLTAQIALVFAPLELAYFFIDPFSTAILWPVAAAVTFWPVLWYVIFALPHELVDRHAERSRLYVDASALHTSTGPLDLSVGR